MGTALIFTPAVCPHRVCPKGRPSPTQHGQGQSGNNLVGLQAHRCEGMYDGDQHSRNDGGAQPKPGIARMVGNDECGNRAHGHHAFNTQVENAGAFTDDLADGAEQQGVPATRVR
jgi:hypothetical protein